MARLLPSSEQRAGREQPPWPRPAARSARAWAAAARPSRPRRSAAARASDRRRQQGQRAAGARAGPARVSRPLQSRASPGPSSRQGAGVGEERRADARRRASAALAPQRRSRMAAAAEQQEGADLARDDELALGAGLVEPPLGGRFGLLRVARSPRPCSAARAAASRRRGQPVAEQCQAGGQRAARGSGRARRSCSGRATKKTGSEGTMRPMAPSPRLTRRPARIMRRGDPRAGAQRVAAEAHGPARRPPPGRPRADREDGIAAAIARSSRWWRSAANRMVERRRREEAAGHACPAWPRSDRTCRCRQTGLDGDQRAADMDRGQGQPRREAEEQANHRAPAGAAEPVRWARAAGAGIVPPAAGLTRIRLSSRASSQAHAAAGHSARRSPGRSSSAAPSRAKTRSTPATSPDEQLGQHGPGRGPCDHGAPRPAMRPNRPRVKSPSTVSANGRVSSWAGGWRAASGRRRACSPASGSAPAGARSARPRPAPPAGRARRPGAVTQRPLAAEHRARLSGVMRRSIGQIGIRMIS